MITPNNSLAIALFFFFKTIPALIAGASIYFGYKLFILGVTGQASIVVDAGTVGGQLINAAPGLFFGVGGLVALIVIVWKGVNIRITSPTTVEFLRSEEEAQKLRYEDRQRF